MGELRRKLAAVALIAVGLLGVGGPAWAGHGYYTNSSGNKVHVPIKAPAPPAGATAQCNDGTYSFSQHHSGTCSGHHGVARWLH